MKKYILTLAAFFFFSAILIGQNLTRQELIDINKNRVDRLLKNDVLLPVKQLDFAEIGVYKLDSIVLGFYDLENGLFTEKVGKDEYTYDENGYPESVVFYGFGEGVYSIYERYLFEYSEDGHMLDFLLQFYDEEWEDYNRRVFSYDEEGKLIERLYYEAYYGPELDLLDRYLYTYDSLGDLLSDRLQAFQFDEWIDQTETRYTYDEHGNNTSYSFWDLGKGENGLEQSRTNYFFDTLDQVVLEVEYSYNNELDSVLPVKKDSFIYNDEGLLMEELSSYYSGEEWLIRAKKVYSYQNSEIPYLIEKFGNMPFGNWTLSSQEEIILDEYDNITLKLNSEVYSHGSNNLTPWRKWEFDRSEEVFVDDLIPGSKLWMEVEAFMDIDFKGFQIGQNAVSRYRFYYWDSANENWESEYYDADRIFYYSGISTNSSEEIVLTPHFQVYPNPADRLLTVETDLTNAPFDLYLYNMFGQRVFRKSISGQEQIVLPTLPEGIYVLQLSKDNEVLGSQRIVIQH